MLESRFRAGGIILSRDHGIFKGISLAYGLSARVDFFYRLYLGYKIVYVSHTTRKYRRFGTNFFSRMESVCNDSAVTPKMLCEKTCDFKAIKVKGIFLSRAQKHIYTTLKCFVQFLVDTSQQQFPNSCKEGTKLNQRKERHRETH